MPEQTGSLRHHNIIQSVSLTDRELRRERFQAPASAVQQSHLRWYLQLRIEQTTESSITKMLNNYPITLFSWFILITTILDDGILQTQKLRCLKLLLTATRTDSHIFADCLWSVVKFLLLPNDDCIIPESSIRPWIILLKFSSFFETQQLALIIHFILLVFPFVTGALCFRSWWITHRTAWNSNKKNNCGYD